MNFLPKKYPTALNVAQKDCFAVMPPPPEAMSGMDRRRIFLLFLFTIKSEPMLGSSDEN